MLVMFAGAKKALAFRATLTEPARFSLFPNVLGLVPFSTTAAHPC